MELEVDDNGKDVLTAHIAKANPQWKDFNQIEEILCIFNGPHAYISSSWYTRKKKCLLGTTLPFMSTAK